MGMYIFKNFHPQTHSVLLFFCCLHFPQIDMGSAISEPHQYLRILFKLLILMAIFRSNTAFPVTDDDRYYDREVASPGAHQLASWIASQLRRGPEFAPAQDVPILPYRLPVHGKRNSELTSSIMSIPRTMIDNGRK